MKKTILFFFITLILASCSESKVRVACVGDSITEGAGITKQNRDAYPAVLDSLLIDAEVLNCGRGGTATQKRSDFSYWDTKEFSNLFVYNPEIVILKIGTNDTKPQNWGVGDFEKDYQALIDTLRTMPSSPKIVMCIPAPIFHTIWGINDSALVAGVIPVIKKIAKKNSLQLIDLNTPLKSHPEFFPDGVHPNEAGAKTIASIIASELEVSR